MTSFLKLLKDPLQLLAKPRIKQFLMKQGVLRFMSDRIQELSGVVR